MKNICTYSRRNVFLTVLLLAILVIGMPLQGSAEEEIGAPSASVNDDEIAGIGRIDDIGQSSITINDSGFRLNPKLKMYEERGTATSIRSFKAGMAVSYVFKDSPHELLEIRKISETEHEPGPEQETSPQTAPEKKTGGDVIFNTNGVWQN